MSDHVLFKKSKKEQKNAVEWPVKNYSVINERDRNVAHLFAYQVDDLD